MIKKIITVLILCFIISTPVKAQDPEPPFPMLIWGVTNTSTIDGILTYTITLNWNGLTEELLDIHAIYPEDMKYVSSNIPCAVHKMQRIIECIGLIDPQTVGEIVISFTEPNIPRVIHFIAFCYDNYERDPFTWVMMDALTDNFIVYLPVIVGP